MKNDGKAAGTAKIYARFLTRCAEHYAVTINEQTVRSDADVRRIINGVTAVVNQRDRWAKGTFNISDVTRNLIFALQAYARFTQAAFPAPPPARVQGSGASAPASHATLEASAASTGSPIEPAMDVPLDELPPRMRTEVYRLVRNAKRAREVKAAHADTCQVCAGRLEFSPGCYYSEGHHLKPLGHRHNGPDVKDNILCVCPNCHAKLDFAVVKLDPKKLRIVAGHSVRQEFIDYHNQLCP